MIVWRVSRRAYAESPLSGEGARLHGGRWNHVGVAVVYTSESLSLAVLEYLVNLSIVDLPDDLVSIQIEIPNRLKRSEISVSGLPKNWRTYPATDELKDIGTEWARKANTAVLVIPSVVIPSEHNYLINPKRPLASRIKVVSIQPFAIDARILSRGRRRRGPPITR